MLACSSDQDPGVLVFSLFHRNAIDSDPDNSLAVDVPSIKCGSFAQVCSIRSRSVCAFSKDSRKLMVICADGDIVLATIQPGECPRFNLR